MPLKKLTQGLPSDLLAAEGLLYQDFEAVTPCQRECTTRLGMTIQMEQEAYLNQHPEIPALLEVFMSKMTRTRVRKSKTLKEAAEFLVRPIDVMDAEVRARLHLPPDGPYTQNDKPLFDFKDEELEFDLRRITEKHYPEAPWSIPTTTMSTPNTLSSSFLSVKTSDTTLPTPEPVRTPEPTLSETLFAQISNIIDKAFYLHVDEPSLRYDTAFVEVSKAIEQAMEIPVIEIREDLAELLFNAYKMFELVILEKERIAAEQAWEKRMRKKMKRTLRRQYNFKGHETPPTPRSEVSSHESYLKPPPRPCICHPQYHYNRYSKDRFGIYMPRHDTYNDNNVTATPVISIPSVTTDDVKTQDDINDTKSLISNKSTHSTTSQNKEATVEE